ncbi:MULTISPECIES: hypothetical protein [Fusobacterium]|uniref:hypothetical protein n=1 Tax=Fusobacterium TaxID=848 RepID=UPI0025C41F58|nr:hypothetical protein [Fusobacterium sp.]MCI7224387.1 hypothetical protein [Fusobacterium sp.]MDD7409970.1 hypothetical protein [Fusobacteriaceae bacterium]MDY5712330.1 hypothetical protein [Fusobacterium gastrosuis]
MNDVKKIFSILFYYSFILKKYKVNKEFELFITTPFGALSGTLSFDGLSSELTNFSFNDFLNNNNLVLNTFFENILKERKQDLENCTHAKNKIDEIKDIDEKIKYISHFLEENEALYEELKTEFKQEETVVFNDVTLYYPTKIKLPSFTIFTKNILGISFIKKN